MCENESPRIEDIAGSLKSGEGGEAPGGWIGLEAGETVARKSEICGRGIQEETTTFTQQPKLAQVRTEPPP